MHNILTYKSQLAYMDLQNVFPLLNGIRYGIIKGEPLSLLAYNSVGNRMSSDIDILIHRKDIKYVSEILIKNGYVQYKSDVDLRERRLDNAFMLSSSHQIRPFIKNRGAFILNIDINHDIFWGEYTGKRINIHEFLNDTIELEIYNSIVRTLPPIKAIIQLILHQYKDMNSIFLLASRKAVRKSMFCDLYHLLMNNIDSIKTDQFYNLCAEYEIIPYVYYVLYHTGLLYNDVILKEYIDLFKTSEGECLLNCYGLNENERHVWRYDFRTRLESNNVFDLINDDLSDKDIEKITLNKRVFLHENE